jgi:hypothetical protein
VDDKRDSLPMDPAPSSPELCDEDGGKSSALDEVAVDALMPGSLRERIEALEARCATCNLWTNVKRGVRACRCDKFPLALPLDLGYGDLVMCTTGTRPTEATALYFVYAGTKAPGVLCAGNNADWSRFVTPHDGIIVTVAEPGDTQSWQLFPVECVSAITVVDLVGRRTRAPAWYEPCRLAASRRITEVRRRQCFNQKLDGRHRCFCCYALLVFSMQEEFTINTGVNTPDAEKVRCHEAGHVFAHSKGVILFPDDVDSLWNLIPLCHNCNTRMGRQLAFQFIGASNPPHCTSVDYTTQKHLFERNLRNFHT